MVKAQGEHQRTQEKMNNMLKHVTYENETKHNLLSRNHTVSNF